MSTELYQRTSSTANISVSFSLRVAASYYQSEAHVPLNAAAAINEAERIVREIATTSHHAPIIDEEQAEEREWDAIVSKPNVLAALRRMAVEARKGYYAGETKEGGFAIE